MKHWILSLVLVACCAATGRSGFVLLDDYNGASAPVNLFAGATVTQAGTVYGPTAVLVNTGGNITYSGMSFAKASYAPNWLLTFNVDQVFGGGVTATVTVNGSAANAKSVALSGIGNFSINFLDAALASGPTINTVGIVFSGAGLSSINSIAATPEPASMLTAGLFSLMGGMVYRRRRAKKATAIA